MVPEDEGGGGAHEAGLRRMIDAYQGGAAARVEHTVDRVLMASIPYYQGMSREMVCAAVTRMFMAVGEDLELGDAGCAMAERGAHAVGAGVSPADDDDVLALGGDEAAVGALAAPPFDARKSSTSF